MMNKIFMMLLLAMAVLSAKMTYSSEIDILMAARGVDAATYCYVAGVCVEDTPLLDPHFAGMRVEMCKKNVMYQQFGVVLASLPCFANFVDYIAWQPNSYARQAYHGIQAYNAGNKTRGLYLIHASIPYEVKIVDE